MSKEKDFYDEPQPGIIDDDEKGLILQFSANGRNISDENSVLRKSTGMTAFSFNACFLNES